IRTNEPLSITPGDRGTVVILQEMTVGKDGQMYTITATEQAYPEKATADDKKLAAEALKKAKTVLIYKLPKTHNTEAVNAALTKLKTVQFNTLCYPY
ncbi:phage tail sheath protein, partial [Clostridioides difficile]|nr:phage tail sheath protein [Clostridioides difficile]